MDVDAFIQHLRQRRDYAGQIVYLRSEPPRQARCVDAAGLLGKHQSRLLAEGGIERLYSHQATALELLSAGRDVVVATGTGSGKSLCYLLRLVELLAGDGQSTALLLFPTKALCQDQFRALSAALSCAGLGDVLAGVCDGDTAAATRRRLAQAGRVILTNPDMLHASILPNHARWSRLLAGLRLVVVDELHVYNGAFGSNAANLFRRLERMCEHYGSRPQWAACSATIANPLELSARLTGRDFELVDDDGSPRGPRSYLLWNPPRVRRGQWHSRRSANVEAHELMADLVRRGVATVTFSKSKMTAEMIHRYVREGLAREAPHLADKVTPYRGGYLPADRRQIEKRLFDGELLGVSATRALELGIDVGSLEACIIVGYPGTLASFCQQAGRAGRRDAPALVVLVGLDTAINQYIMSNPDYLFARPVEQCVLDGENPFVLAGQLRCAAHEKPLECGEVGRFGPLAPLVLEVLAECGKLRRLGERWYHAASETPQHEVSLREGEIANVVIEDVQTGQVIGELNVLDAQPIIHPEAIYMHAGQTYRVLELDSQRNIARVQRVDSDYYTNPIGGEDVHHVDRCLRERPLGAARACWGEVTAHSRTWGYERIHFYSLDVLSVHRVNLPTMVLETMAFWIIPPERLMEDVRRSGLDAHAGLRGIGYGMRMLLGLFITCDTLDFSHSVGSVNSPWNAVFVYEGYPRGLGFTERAYERLGEILPRVLEVIRNCPCDDGCPCCVGKPLRPYATWNVELHEGTIPSKAAARMILEGLLVGDLDTPDSGSVGAEEAGLRLRLQRAVLRRIERMREPKVFHDIEPIAPEGFPMSASASRPGGPGRGDNDACERASRREGFQRDLHRRVAMKIDPGKIRPLAGKPPPPAGMRLGPDMPPTAFAGQPAASADGDAPGHRDNQSHPPAALSGPHAADCDDASDHAGKAIAPRAADERAPAPIRLGDDLAERARKLKRREST